MTAKLHIRPGQVWRDRYYDQDDSADGLDRTRRTIRLEAPVAGTTRWAAVTLTNCLGAPDSRRTKVSEKTLLNGYELVGQGASS